MERSPPSPQPRRRHCFYCCGRLGCALILVGMLSIALVGVCAAAYERWSVVMADTDALARPCSGNETTTIVVVLKGEEVNLGKTTGYTLEEQLDVLWFLTTEKSEEGFDRWYLESWEGEKKILDEEWKQSLEWLDLS